MINLIEIALTYWIKNQCRKIENLHININTSISELFRGKIKSTKVIASKIDFKGIQIDSIEIESESINLQLIPKVKGPEVKIKNNFNIKAELVLSEPGIKSILCSQEWDWVSQTILGQSNNKYDIKNVEVIQDSIEFTFSINDDTDFNKKSFYLFIDNDKLAFKDKKSEGIIYLPMDKSIKIESLSLKDSIVIVNMMAKINN